MQEGTDANSQPHRFLSALSIAASSLGVIVLLSAAASSAAAQGATGEDNLPRYWEIHAFLMTAGTILFVGTYSALWLKYVSRVKGVQLPALAVKVSRMWYRMHVYLGVAGASLLAAGTVWGYVMVEWAHKGQHLRLAHSYIGVIARCIPLVPLVLGFAVRKVSRRKLSMRRWHVALGLAGIIILLVGLVSGWALE